MKGVVRADHRPRVIKVPGLRGVRVYRSLDDAGIVLPFSLDAIDDHTRLLESGILVSEAGSI